jgi:hypothetical protein
VSETPVLASSSLDNDYSEKYMATTDAFFDDKEIGELESQMTAVNVSQNIGTGTGTSYSAVARNNRTCPQAVLTNSGASKNCEVSGIPTREEVSGSQRTRKKAKLKQESGKDRPVILWFRRDLR